MDIKSFLDILEMQIKENRVKEAVREELSDHMEMSADEKISEGMTQEEAEKAVWSEMGDPTELGARLNRIHSPSPAPFTIALVFMMTLTGGYIRLFIAQGDNDVILRMTAAVIAGVVLFAAVTKTGYTFFLTRRKELYEISVGIMFVLLLPHFAGNRMPLIIGEDTHLKMWRLTYIYELFLPISLAMTYSAAYAPRRLLTGQLYLLPICIFTLCSHSFEQFMVCIAAGTVMFAYNVIMNTVCTAKIKAALLTLPLALGIFSVILWRGYLCFRLAVFRHDETLIPNNNSGQRIMYGRFISGLTSSHESMIIFAAVLFLIFFIITAMKLPKLTAPFGRFITLLCLTVIICRLLFSVMGDLNIFRFIGVSYPLINAGSRSTLEYISDIFLISLICSAYRERKMFPEKNVRS